VTLTEDVWVKSFTPIAPRGVHHTFVAIDPSPEEDGTRPCGVFGSQWILLFGSGIGSPSLAFPDGVGMRLAAGTQVVFNLHLFNASDTPVSGEAALDVMTAPEAEVEHEAEAIAIGPLGFQIPPMTRDFLVNGQCTNTEDSHFFAVFPHMHQFGRHIKVWTESGEERAGQTVYDEEYQFEDQDYRSFEPVAMAKGDRIHVECTYDNFTSRPISFGDSSLDEMCFAVAYRYPPLEQAGPICLR